jgi:hypothetical protein
LRGSSNDVGGDLFAALGRDSVDIGDDALTPVVEVDMLGIGIPFNRLAGGGLGLLDRLGVGTGLDRDAIERS